MQARWPEAGGYSCTTPGEIIWHCADDPDDYGKVFKYRVLEVIRSGDDEATFLVTCAASSYADWKKAKMQQPRSELVLRMADHLPDIKSGFKPGQWKISSAGDWAMLVPGPERFLDESYFQKAIKKKEIGYMRVRI